MLHFLRRVSPEPRAALALRATAAFRPCTLRWYKSAGNGLPPVNESGKGDPSQVVCRLSEISKRLPTGRSLFQDVSLSFYHGAKIGILGLNGTGKSTLLKVIAGIETDFDGEVWTKPHLRIGYLPQEPQLDPERTVKDNIMDGLRDKLDLLERFDQLSELMADPNADFDEILQEQADVQSKIDAADAWNLNHVVETTRAALQCPTDDKDVASLSGGERRRVALCRLLLEAPDVLLLDEPTNHLDTASISWLENFLHTYPGAVMAITHDRYFLDNVAAWILELDRGTAYAYEGNYAIWLKKKQERLDMDNKKDKARARAMAEELEWLGRGAKAQQKKSKARRKRVETMKSEDAERRVTKKYLSGQVLIPPGPRLGNHVLRADSISVDVGGKKLVKDLSLNITNGDIIGVIGGNGCGKTSLMKVLAGDEEPSAGSIELGQTVRLGFVSQARWNLNPNTTVLDAIAEGDETIQIGEKVMDIRAFMAQFNITGELQTKVIGNLSGGERNRVHMARVFKTAPNFLILDEPTNDLDVDTLRSLEEALNEFEGSAIIVSHDRYFLDRVTNRTLAFEGNGKVTLTQVYWLYPFP